MQRSQARIPYASPDLSTVVCMYWKRVPFCDRAVTAPRYERAVATVAGIPRFPSPASSLTENLCIGTISRNVHSGPEVFNAGKVALQGGATLGDVKVRPYGATDEITHFPSHSQLWAEPFRRDGHRWTCSGTTACDATCSRTIRTVPRAALSVNMQPSNMQPCNRVKWIT